MQHTEAAQDTRSHARSLELPLSELARDVPHTRSFSGTLPPPSYQASTGQNTSFDITGSLERKLMRYNASQSVFIRWMFEVLSVVTSAICMGATIAILAFLDNHPLSKWPLGLTIINILSKVASAALILPISEAIGQLKWSWFYGKTSRDAFDFEIFDKASRGAWGSFLLLCRTRGRSLAALGAILTVLLLGIDMFFQQLTDLPTRETLHGVGLVPRTIRYDPQYVPEFVNGFEASQQDGTMSAVVDTFFVTNGTQPVAFGNGTRPEIPLSCPTSTCTWQPYDTLGVCSQCTEVPSLLSHACLKTRIDWTSGLNSTVSSYPIATVCGYFLNVTTEEPILMSGYVVGSDGEPEGETLIMRTLPLISNPLREPLWGGSIHFKTVRNPIIDVLISSTLNAAHVHANVAPTIHECVLAHCVMTIKSSYSLGTYHEDIIAHYINHTIKDTPWSISTYDDGSTDQTYLENVTINVPSAGSNFPAQNWGVTNTTMVQTVLIFDRMFPAFTTVSNGAMEGLLRWRLGSPTDVRTKLLRINPWQLPNNASRHLERLAMAMTNVMRSEISSNELIAGEAFISETYVVVHWAWLAFPLIMLGLSIVFLTATILKTSKSTSEAIGVWKTSAMPTLFYSLPETMRHDLNSSSAWHITSKDNSRKARIRLVPDRGWRVSGQIHTSPMLPRSN